MERFSRELFDMMVTSARQWPKPEREAPSCPVCGGPVSGATAQDGREDATCGSPHCRSEWYAEVAERY